MTNKSVNQLQLNYSTNIHLLIPRFMKSVCVITIQLNTHDSGWGICLCMWKPLKEVMSTILNNGCVYIKCFSPSGPWQRHYNGVTVYYTTMQVLFPP